MPAARAESVAVGAGTALTPIAEETENKWTKATPVSGKRSDGRGRSLSSGKKQLKGALTGKLLPGELRLRKTAPPSSIKRLKPKDAVSVAAVVKKPKRSDSATNNEEMTPAHEELQATKKTAHTELSVAANAQRPKAKMKLSKSERALKKAKAALKLAEANVEAEMISIKKQHKVQEERDRQARERDAKALKVSPPHPEC